MTELDLAAAAGPGLKPTAADRYPPSFIDRIIDSVERLPVPYWVTYLALFFFLAFLSHLVSWWDGWLPFFTFSPLNLVYQLWFFAPLAIMTHLDQLARDSLTKFSALLDITDEEMRELEYEFTTMPARSVLINSIVWFFFFLLVQAAGYKFIAVFGVGTAGTIYWFALGFVANWFGCAIYYHTFRQLRLVNRTVRMVEKFNLFTLEPVYAFSRVTAQTGMAWVALLALTLLFFPTRLINVFVLVMLVAIVILAISAFVLPLWVVHRRLVSEKRRLLAERDRRVDANLARLHACLDENELEKVGQLNTAMAGLITEREVLDRIPTWPWRAGTLSSFLSAIVLPIFLFLIQLIIGNMLAP